MKPIVFFAALSFVCAAFAYDSAVREWRIKSENVKVKAVEEFRGRQNALGVKFPIDAEKAKGSVSFGTYSIRELLDSWIPPYVGLRARRLELAVFPVKLDRGSNPKIELRFLPKWSDFEWRKDEHSGWLANLVEGEWTDLSFSIDHPDMERLAGITIKFDNNKRSEFVIAGLSLVLDDGTRYELMNEDDPLYLTGMNRPLCSKAIKPLPNRSRIQFGVGGHWCSVYGDSAAAMGDYMKKYLPEYDVVVSLGGIGDPAMVKKMSKSPDNIFWQIQGGQHDLKYPQLRNALVMNKRGEFQSQMHNSIVATHPLFQRALEDRIAYCGSLGFNNMQRYDYVWYYPQGHSGFDDASVAAFREDLQEKDEGLLLSADGIRPERTIHFWDYFADYYGKRLQPSEFGLSDWSDYKPDVSKVDTERLHLSLVAYEWLRLAQRFIVWTRAHCHGGAYDFLLNGEFCGNGNDHVYLSRLKGVGVCSPEYFYDTPKTIDALSHTLGRYLRNAKACGSRFGITVETSRGGGGNQPYWSPKTAYAICYFLASFGFEGIEYDGLMGAMSWDEYVSSKNWFDKMELQHGMASVRGYRQARLDGARPRKPSGVYHLIERAVAGVTTRLFCVGENHPDQPMKGKDFRGELQRAGIDYEATDPQELPDLIGSADVIFSSLSVRRDDIDALLDQWQKAKPGRRLITDKAEFESAIARLPLTQRPLPHKSAADIGRFECKVGSVAVLFNRKAADEADRNAWNENIWRHFVYKRIGDWSKLLFQDKYPDADVYSEVPVSTDGKYRVYRFLSDTEAVVDAKDGFLRLSLGDDFTDIFYYAPDTDEFRSFLDGVKRERVLTSDFFAY